MMPSLEGRPRSAPTGSTGTIARRRCPQAKAPLRFFGFQIVQSRCGRRFRLATGAHRGEGIGEGNGLAADDAEGDGTRGAGVDAVAAAGAVVQGQLADFPLSVQLPPEYGEAVDHLRYEAADVVYHLLVVLERYGITLDEFAAELNNRMTEGERPHGAVRLHDEFVRRGK